MRRPLALIAATITALLALLAAAPVASAADDDLVWGTKPTDNAVGTGRPNFAYLAQPGGTMRDSIDVSNHGTSAITVSVYAADAFTPDKGGVDALTSDERSTDLGSWITLDTDSITVQPHQVVTVPFTLTVPTTATPGDHTAAILTSLRTDAAGTPLTFDRRIGSRVFVRVAGTLKPTLAITKTTVRYDAGFNPFEPGTATVTYTVTNTGNMRLDAHQSIRVSGLPGAARTVTPKDAGEILPGSSRTFTQKVTGVWADGRLTATVTLRPFVAEPKAGDPTSIRAVSVSTSTWAAQKGHLAAVPVLVACAAGGVGLVRWRRGKVKAAIDAAVSRALESAGNAGGSGSQD